MNVGDRGTVDLLADEHLASVRATPELATQIASLVPTRSLTPDETDDVFARIAWSVLTEPGDSVAGELIASFGASQALALVVARIRVERLWEMLRAHEANDEISLQALKKALKRWEPRLDRKLVTDSMDVAVGSGSRALMPGHLDWPTQLDELGRHAPVILWTRGETSLLRTSYLAVVGARASTAYGENVTNEIVDYASHMGLGVVSGAAYGIDAVAHRAALSLDAPTIAVMAGGIDRYYPAGHTELIKRIERRGVVCAELPPGAAPTRWRFLHKNGR